MDLRDYLKILRKRWWIIALVAVIAVASAYVFSKTQPTIYRSIITLNNEPARPDYGQTLTIKNILRSYTKKLSSLTMAQKVNTKLQLDMRSEAVLGMVNFTSDEADLTIQVDAKHRDGATAQRVAQTFAELFVQQRQLENLEIDQRDRILTTIIDNASAPEVFSPKTSINMLAGGVLGALLGVVVVFALEWLESDVVRSSEDVERYTGLPVIGSIPTITAREAQTANAPRARLAFWKRA